MPIAPATRLGQYEVISLIGLGGMGEVYRATDVRLGRDVAIKVLPDSVASDNEKLGRFEREARLLAALNHPNIATIHGLEQAGDRTCLVMELVPGDTLRERLAREGKVSVEEALAITRQIAEALEAAHDKGIIHRDLKPANVKITADGRVKVLDFGLAKALSGDSVSEDVSNSPTLSMAATMQGVILGTAAYMSPEQARGKAATKAADIWALGCVMYELMTGRAAFEGEDVTEILAAVVMKEPAFDALPAHTPDSIKTLVRRCLRKDRRQRLQDATSVRIEIEEALAAPVVTAAAKPVSTRRAPSLAIAALVGAIALVLGGGIGAWLSVSRTPRAQPAAVVRLTSPLPPGVELAYATPALDLSPDGTQLAYVGTRGGVQQIYIRSMDSLDAKPLPGTEGAGAIFFSPDGRWLGFIAGAKLKKISTSGGVPVTLADAGANPMGDWSPDGTIVFREPNGGLVGIPASGGATRSLIPIDRSGGLGVPQFPDVLPGGRAILFTSSTANASTADEKAIEILTIETGARKTLIQGGSYARYLPTGHVVFLRSGTLLAAPFDLNRLEVTGPPVPVIENVRESVTGVGAFACAGSGTCVYVGGGMIGAHRTVSLVDRTGVGQRMPLAPQSYGTPRYSPAGDKVAFWLERVNCDVGVYEIARGVLTRLSVDAGSDNHYPTWTPDGKRIAYTSLKRPAPGYELFWKAADGSGSEEPLSQVRQNLTAGASLSWSPDGSVLAYSAGGDIWLLPMSGDRKPRTFFESRFTESTPAFSPDGRWLAYVSDESGRPEVQVRPFPGPGAKYAVSTGGGTEPVWARSGRELFFRNGDQLLVAAISTQSAFGAARPKVLFTGPYVRTAGRINYDVSPDGQRFVMLEPGEEESSSQMNVVMNWFDELKRRVPTDGN